MTPEQLDPGREAAHEQHIRDRAEAGDLACALQDRRVLLTLVDSLRLALDASEKARAAAERAVHVAVSGALRKVADECDAWTATGTSQSPSGLIRSFATSIEERGPRGERAMTHLGYTGVSLWPQEEYAIARAEAAELRADTAEAALAESRAREVVLVEAAKRASDEYDNEVDQAPFLAAKRDLDDVLADLSTAAREWRERVRFEAERRVRSEMAGPLDVRVAGIKRRAKEMIERDPKEALANILTALADDPAAINDAREEGRALGREEAALACVRAASDGVYRDGMIEAARRIRALSTSPAASSSQDGGPF